MMETPKTYRLHELAQAAGVSDSELRRIVQTHDVPAVDAAEGVYGEAALTAIRDARLEGHRQRLGNKLVETR